VKRGRLGRVLGWVALAFVLVAGVRILVLTAAVAPDGALHRHVDGVMFVGHVWNAAFGEIAGRDYVSTYGPLAQWIAAKTARARQDGDIRSSAPLALLGLRLVSFLTFAVWLSALPGASPWRTVGGLSLLLLFSVPRHHPTLRVALALLAVTLSVRSSGAQGRLRRWILAASGGLVLLATQLVTPDFALYAVAALLTAVLTSRWLPGGRGDLAESQSLRETTGVALAAWGVANVALWTWFGATSQRPSSSWLDYPRETIEMIRTYSWAVGRPFSESGIELAGLAVLAVATTWCAAARASRSKADDGRHLWLALALLALFAIKGGLVRSGSGHVALALTAMLALLTALLPRRAQGARQWVIWIALISLAWSVWPDPASRQSLKHARRALAEPLGPAWRSLTTVTATDAGLPRQLRDLERREGSLAPIYAYPFENQLGPFFERRLVTPTHQAYAAHDAAMQQRVVARLDAEPQPPEVFFSLGGLAGSDPSPQRNATRASTIFEYLLEAYRWDPRIVDSGTFRLIPAARRRLGWRPLGPRLRPSDAAGAAQELRIYELASISNCRVVALELSIEYPWWRPLGWPGRLDASFRARGREVASTRIVPLALGQPFRAIAVLVPSAEFPGLFDEPASSAALAIDEIRLEPQVTGGLGVRPRSIQLVRAECF